MVALETSVRASGEPRFTRAQQLSRLHPTKLLYQPHFIEEFINLFQKNVHLLTIGKLMRLSLQR